MSLITHIELVQLVADGVLTGVHPSHINGASIDVTLGSTLYIEAIPRGGYDRVDLMAKEVPNLELVQMHGFYDLAPGQFCLGSTQELFNLPNDIAAEFRLKSSGARAGLDAALAMWADPSWTGSTLTLELRNNLRHHHLRLRPGMKIGQMIFLRGAPVPNHASYAVKGQYNNCVGTTPSKGIR
jgi:dCTP deaminase